MTIVILTPSTIVKRWLLRDLISRYSKLTAGFGGEQAPWDPFKVIVCFPNAIMVTYVADLQEMKISDQQLSPNSGDQGSEIRDQRSGIMTSPVLRCGIQAASRQTSDPGKCRTVWCQKLQGPRKPWNPMGENREVMVYWGAHQAARLHCSAPTFSVLHCTSLHFTAIDITVLYSTQMHCN